MTGYLSCNPIQKLDNQPWITDDVNPTINFTTDKDSTCAVMGNESGLANYNYTDMIANGGVECSTTGGINHICTIQASNDFTVGTDKHIFAGCKNSINTEDLNATFGADINIYTYNATGAAEQCTSDCIKVTSGCGLFLENACTSIR